MEEPRLNELAILAGRSTSAAAHDEVIIGKSGHAFRPLPCWRDPFDANGIVSASEVLDDVRTVIGRLDDQLDEVQMVERKFAFKVGRVLSFPAQAREAMGDNRAAGHIAFWAPLLVEVLGGLVVLAVTVRLAR